jgi:hypothetical protein
MRWRRWYRQTNDASADGEVASCAVRLGRYPNDPGWRSRQAFRFGRQTALRSTGDTVDELQAQIEQLKFNAAEYERQIAGLSRELCKARLELAQRRLVDAFAAAPSPSPMVH